LALEITKTTAVVLAEANPTVQIVPASMEKDSTIGTKIQPPQPGVAIEPEGFAIGI